MYVHCWIAWKYEYNFICLAAEDGIRSYRDSCNRNISDDECTTQPRRVSEMEEINGRPTRRIEKKRREISGSRTIHGDRDNGYNASLADIWSSGIVLWCLVGGRPPFRQANPESCEKYKVGKNILKYTQHPAFEHPLYCFLSSCSSIHPSIHPYMQRAYTYTSFFLYYDYKIRLMN